MSNESSPPASSLWFYADASNQPVGPLPFAELEKLATAGLIEPRTKVIEANGTEWKRFAAVAPSPPMQIPASLAQPGDSSPSPNSLWFYADSNNQPVGPVPFVELKKFVAAGVIQPKTQVFEKGGSEWRAFATIAPVPPKLPPATVQPVASRAQSKPANAPRRKLTILALAFLYPAGLWMLWRNKDFEKRTKILVTSICSPVFLLSLPYGQRMVCEWLILFLLWLWLGKSLIKPVKIALSAFCAVLFLTLLPTVGLHQNNTNDEIWETALTRIGNKCEVVKNAMLFADEPAYNAFIAAKDARDVAKLDELSKSSRAFPSEVGERFVIIGLRGFKGFAHIRAQINYRKNNYTRQEVWTHPVNLIPEQAEPKFFMGEEVAIKSGTDIYSDSKLMLALSEAERNDDVEKVKELSAKLDAEAIHLAANRRGKILAANPQNNLYRIGGSLPDGLTFTAWTEARNIELTTEQKEVRAQKRAQLQEAEADLSRVRMRVGEIAKNCFNEKLKDVKIIPQYNGGYGVEVEFRDSIGKKRMIESKMRHAYKELYTAPGLQIRRITIGAFLPFQNKFGHDSEDLGYETRLDAETAGKVMWEKEYSLDFTQIWELRFIHPALENSSN